MLIYLEIAIRSDGEILILNENGSSIHMCVVKRSGVVPATGLTVYLEFERSGGRPLAGMYVNEHH